MARSEFDVIFDNSIKPPGEYIENLDLKDSKNILVLQETSPTSRTFVSIHSFDLPRIGRQSQNANLILDDDPNSFVIIFSEGISQIIVDFGSVAIRRITTVAQAINRMRSTEMGLSEVSVSYSMSYFGPFSGNDIVARSDGLEYESSDSGKIIFESEPVRMRYARIKLSIVGGFPNSLQASVFQCSGVIVNTGITSTMDVIVDTPSITSTMDVIVGTNQVDDVSSDIAPDIIPVGTSDILIEVYDDARDNWKILVPQSVFLQQSSDKKTSKVTRIGIGHGPYTNVSYYNQLLPTFQATGQSRLRMRMNVEGGNVDTSVAVIKIF